MYIKFGSGRLEINPTLYEIYNIIEDFDEDLIVKLHALSESNDFMIFEDRKFADIGAVLVNIVYAQALNSTRLFRVLLNDQITFIHGKQDRKHSRSTILVRRLRNIIMGTYYQRPYNSSRS